MLTLFILLLSLALVVAQILLDRRSTVLSPHILFQLYFIIQLPLNLFLGTNYYLPRFDSLSPLTPTRDILWLGFVILLAQSVFVFVIYIMELRPAPQRLAAVSWRKARANLVIVAIFILGYASFLGLIYINGGFEAFAEMRELWRTAGVSGQGWVLLPATTLVAFAVNATLVNNRDQFARSLGWLKILILYVIAVIPASQLGFRAFIFLPLLQVGYFYHSFIRKIPTAYIVLGSFVMLLGFTLYGIQREIPYTSRYGGYIEYLYYIYISRPDLTYTVALRSMGADIVQTTFDHMEVYGDYMKLYPVLIEAVTIPIPSALWGDKPLPLTVEFSQRIFGLGGGVSPTIVGEGYWHANVLGVVVMMVAAGLLHAMFRSIERRSTSSLSSALLMLSLYPLIIMMAESFQGYFNGLILILIINWLFQRIVGAAPNRTNEAGRPPLAVASR